MTDAIHIAKRPVGPGHKCFLIAEVAQAHDGSLGAAHAFIDAAAASGADAIKFQTHIAAAESSRDEKFRVPLSGQDATRYDYWRRMEFTAEQWHGLKKHSDEAGLIFLSSPFSVAAVDLLQKLGMPAWKIGSGEFRSVELMEAMRAAGGPILLSTGMSRWQEIAEAASSFRERNTLFALLQCTSLYPTPLANVGLNVIDRLRKYDCPVGLSDHSGTVWPGLAAMARGLDLFEAHVIFDKRMYGPDTKASLTFAEFATLAQARDAFHDMESHPVDKDEMAGRLSTMRDLFTKSIALGAAQPAGAVLTEEMLTPRKPGTGISFADREKLLGKRLRHAVEPDRLLRWEDLES